MANEIRVRPDGKAVAIASDHPEGSPAAGYGVIDAVHGGYWENRPENVADWPVQDIRLPDPAVIDAEVAPDHPELQAAHAEA